MFPGGWEWIIIIAVLLLLFGAKRLPDMARSIGQSARVFKGEMKGLKDDEKKKQDEQAAAAAPVQPAEIPPVQPVNTATVNGAAHANGTTPLNQPAAPQDARPAGQ